MEEYKFTKFFNNFTRDNINLFMKSKYNLSNDNILLKKIRKKKESVLGFISKNNINPKIDIIDKIDINIKELLGTVWVYEKGVIQWLEKNVVKYYKISWLNNIITIICKEEQMKNIKNRIKTICNILDYLKSKSKNPCDYNIILLLTDLKKLKPTKNIIGPKHINTGYTDLYTKQIFIWRYEEFEKVLFHEAIHFLDLDCREHRVSLDINIDGPKSYYEAITDYIAIFYHIIYISIITNIDIKLLLELELGFIRNQALSVNNHFKLGDWNGMITKMIKQKSPAFSYYILKYLLFSYLLENDIKYNAAKQDYNEILNKLIKIGFKQNEFNDIESYRMTLLQL